MNQPIPVTPVNYKFDPTEEYVFYPKPLSRRGSFEDLLKPKFDKPLKRPPTIKKLNDPQVRRQLAKLKPKYPWFLGTVTFLQVAAFILTLVMNMRNTGSIIQTDPFNYLIGPSPGVSKFN